MVAEVVRYALFAVFPLALVYAAATDLLSLTISNRLNLALVAGFLALAPLAGLGWYDFAVHWMAGVAVLAAAFACFAMGWIGGGDAKLAAVIALWLGLAGTLEFVLLASLFGGVLTLILLGFRRTVVPVSIIRQPWIQRLHDESTGVPYGVALAAAGLATYPHSVWMQVVVG